MTKREHRRRLKRLLYGYDIDQNTKTIKLKDLLDEIIELFAQK